MTQATFDELKKIITESSSKEVYQNTKQFLTQSGTEDFERNAEWQVLTPGTKMRFFQTTGGNLCVVLEENKIAIASLDEREMIHIAWQTTEKAACWDVKMGQLHTPSAKNYVPKNSPLDISYKNTINFFPS